MKKSLFWLLFFVFTVHLLGAEYSSSTSFSLLITSGNTRELTLGFDTEQSLNVKKNHFQLKGSVIYGQSEKIKNAEFYYGHLKVKRELAPKVFLLSLGRFERNVLAGYNHRFSLSGGAGYIWVKKEKVEAISEVSLGWGHESNIGQDSTILSYMSLFVSSSVKVALTPTSHIFCQELYSLNLKDPKDFHSTSFVSITADISKTLALKFSYQLFYSHKSVPGFQKMDHYFISSLVLNL